MRTPLPVDPSLLLILIRILVPRDVVSGHDWLAAVDVGERRRKKVDKVFDVGVGWPSAMFVFESHSARSQF